MCLVLHTAGRHMEDSIMAAYIALLIGTLVEHKQVTGCSLSLSLSFPIGGGGSPPQSVPGSSRGVVGR